jgi:hypothetical protein
LLRQAVGNSNYTVFHMTSAAANEKRGNQAIAVLADDDLARATMDLVGDLSTYHPQGKVVLFEGGGDTDIDVLIMTRLFPTFAKQVNLISGGSKNRVRDLYEVLADTAEKVGLASRFFAVTDKDSLPWDRPSAGARQLNWNVYHIENYLMEPRFVRSAAAILLGHDPFASNDDVVDALRQAAEELVPNLVVEQLRQLVNNKVVSTIKLGANPKSTDPVKALIPSITSTYERLDGVRQLVADATWLEAEARRIESELRTWLKQGRWLQEFPGRLILKRFVGAKLSGSASYEAFRNVILDQMADDNFEPSGMRDIVNLISES